MATQKAAAQKEVNVAQALRAALKAVTGMERTVKQLTTKTTRQEAVIERLKSRGNGAGTAAKKAVAKKGPKARAAAEDEDDAPVRKGPKAKAGLKKVPGKGVAAKKAGVKKGPVAKKAGAGVKKAPIKGNAKGKPAAKAKGKDTFLI